MGRILFFLGLALVAWILFKSWQRKQLGEKPGVDVKQKAILAVKPKKRSCLANTAVPTAPCLKV